MSGLRRRYCVFGCDISLSHGVPLHRFPNPDKRPDIFAAWVSCVGDMLTERNRKKIYINKRVCDHHFESAHKTTGGRLIASAIPTILKRVLRSLDSIVESDHNYCRSKREYQRSGQMVDITTLASGSMPTYSTSVDLICALDQSKPSTGSKILHTSPGTHQTSQFDLDFSKKNVLVRKNKAEESRPEPANNIENNSLITSPSNALPNKDEVTPNDSVNIQDNSSSNSDRKYVDKYKENQKGPPLVEKCNTTLIKTCENIKEVENKTYVKAQVGKMYKVEYVDNKIRLVEYCPESNKDLDKDRLSNDTLPEKSVDKVNLEQDNVDEINCDDDTAQDEIDNNDSSRVTKQDVTEQTHSVETFLESCAAVAVPYQQLKTLRSEPLSDNSYHEIFSNENKPRRNIIKQFRGKGKYLNTITRRIIKLKIPPREKENDCLIKEKLVSKENKFYKIVCAGGKITMVEHGTVGDVDGDNLNADTSLNENISSKGIIEENSVLKPSSENIYPQRNLNQQRDALKPVVNLNNSSAKPNNSADSGGADLFKFNTKVFTADKNRIFITKEHLSALQRGEDMVMIPMNNYTTIRTKLEHLEKTNLKYQNELKHLKKLALESITLRRLKEQLFKKFTKAQIDTILHSKNCGWPDKEMERAAYIRQNINQKMYFYLKHHMGFPLPQIEELRKWMINKKLIVPKNKKTADAPQDVIVNNNVQVVYESGQIEQTEGATEEIQPYDTAQTRNSESAQVQSEDPETAQAISSIAQFDQNQRYYIQHGAGPTTRIETIDGKNNYVWEHEIATNEVVVAQSDTKRMRRKHVDVNLRCQLCIKYFETELQVRQHVPLHYYNTHYTNYLDAQAPYRCEFCGESVRTRPLLILHHRAHLGITNFRCWHPGCSFVSNRVKTLTRHSRQHSDSNLQCNHCPARFPHRQLLNLHRNRVHSTRVKRRCRLCHAVTFNDYTYRRHMRTHTRPPKLKCTEPGCTEAFYSTTERKRHRMTHFGDELPFKCPHCPHASYTKSALLTRHMKRHETDKINHCLKCDQIFYDYGEYFEHCITQHGGRRVSLKCACSLSFQSKKRFETHQLQCEFVEKNNVDDNTNELQVEGSTLPQEQTQGDKPKKKRKKKQTTDGDDLIENKKIRTDTEAIAPVVDNSTSSVQIVENILVAEANDQHVKQEAGGEGSSLSMPVIIDGTMSSNVITMTLEEYQQYLLTTHENSEEYGSLNIDAANVRKQYVRQRHT